MSITKEELAQQLDGNKLYGELTKEQEILAKDNNLVVVFGSSDDLMEFRGAIYDEVGCFDGVTVQLDENGIIEPPSGDMDACEDCHLYQKVCHKARTIEAIWCKGDIAWTYTTNISHSTFDIYEDGEVYCIGIVFSL